MAPWRGSKLPPELVRSGALLASVALSWGAGRPSAALVAQESQVHVAHVRASPFRPLELRPPNAFRTAAGTPGPLYWQQRADYSIQASLDTEAHVVSGEETVYYKNNSPDTLRFVWIQLDQNLGSSENALAIVSQQYAPEAGFEGGYVIERVRELQPSGADSASGSKALEHRVEGTLMQVHLDSPLPPEGTVLLDMAWHFQVPLYWRTGRQPFPEGWLYQVAQWFPRMVVEGVPSLVGN